MDEILDEVPWVLKKFISLDHFQLRSRLSVVSLHMVRCLSSLISASVPPSVQAHCSVCGHATHSGEASTLPTDTGPLT